VSASLPAEETRHDPPATLGALLYADKTKPRIPESEWAALVLAIAAHDQRALRGLYDRMQGLVFTLALRICGSRETAEELTVDVFHDVWRRAPGYDPAVGTVVAWVMNLARSRAIDRLRFEQRKKRAPDQPPETLAEVAIDFPDAAEAAQRDVLVRNAVKALPARERRAIESAFLAEKTHAETANQLGEPLGTVKTRIRSALARLRHALSGGLDPP
jgi:RNA polymerase sigma-70 factor (ECF subfamily)